MEKTPQQNSCSTLCLSLAKGAKKLKSRFLLSPFGKYFKVADIILFTMIPETLTKYIQIRTDPMLGMSFKSRFAMSVTQLEQNTALLLHAHEA